MKYIKLFEKVVAQHPFIQASKRGSTNKIKEFIKKGIDVNMKDTVYGKTALMFACSDSYLVMVDVLLKAGANPNLQDNEGRTALMMSSTPKIITLLLENGADPNIQDKDGNTMIMDRTSSVNITPYLLKLSEYNIDFDIRNKDGFNFYDLLMNSIEKWGERNYYLDAKKYMDEHYPQYKEEWELQRDVKKYNL